MSEIDLDKERGYMQELTIDPVLPMIKNIQV